MQGAARQGNFSFIFLIYLAPSGAKYCEKGLAALGKSFGKGLGRFWKKLNFQAVIKSAASAASPTAWGAPDDGARWDDGARPDDGTDSDDGSGAPQAVGEAALAADLIAA